MGQRQKTHRERSSAAPSGRRAGTVVQAGEAPVRARAVRITAKGLTEEERRFLEQNADRLSKTTLRAKFIHSPEEHEDYPGQPLATFRHEVIRRWAEERGARPATVPGTEYDGRPGVLRFDFPGFGGQELKPIDWEDWFRAFDERKLVFVFQEHLRSGRTSNWFMLDSPQREAA